MKKLTRRGLLASTGLMTGAGLWIAGSRGEPSPQEGKKEKDRRGWKYVPVDKALVAGEAVRLYFDGGCMYGVFGSIVGAMAKVAGEPFRSFPLHMMRYGEGGAGGFGSLCWALNGGAAVVGLFELAKERREKVIGELFSWYEATALPIYRALATSSSEEMPKSIAHSVLCHVSVSRWCRVSACDVLDPERKRRCSLLTADVAMKTIELLSRNQQPASSFAGLAAEVKSCLACHGKRELRDAQGKMECNCCHKFAKRHP
jgi:hypothetical protein